MSLLLLDNYDSFTFNLLHLLEPLVEDIEVIRNDEIDIEDLDRFDQIVLSPGPGLPSEAGLMPQLLERHATTKPILGVCLGMQAIAQHFGTPLINMPSVRHGRTAFVNYEEDSSLFAGISSPMEVGLYHSWAVDHENMSEDLLPLAFSQEGWLMALQHRSLALTGIQFHPESILSPLGAQLIENWIASN